MGSREVAKEPSLLEVEPLASEESLQSLALLRQLVASSLGPHGQIKTVQNAVGGHVTMTTSSSRLLSAMSVSRPVLRMMINTVQKGAKEMEDGGLRACCLALRLLETSLSEGILQVPAVVMSDLYDECLLLAKEYLALHQHQLPSDKVNLTFLTCVTETILTSKPFCSLHGDTLDKLTALVLEAFLSSLPDGESRPAHSDRIFLLGLDRAATENSAFFEGFLLECPEFSTMAERPLAIRREEMDFVKVALLTVSASGDAEWAMDAGYEMAVGVGVEDEVKDLWKQLAQMLVDQGVGLLLSQRVVHPAVKAGLSRTGVVCVDRLGAASIPYIKDLTGASPLSVGCSTEDVDKKLGCLDNITHRVMFGKSFLHLTRKCSPVVSIVLTSPWEERRDELKVTVRSALRALETVYFAPHVLPGAGCWNSQMAAYVQHKMLGKLDLLMDKHGCSKSQAQWVVGNFTSCLNQLARTLGDRSEVPFTDTIHHHCWRVPSGLDLTVELAKSMSLTCACGLISASMVDSFEMLVKEKVPTLHRKVGSDMIVEETKNLAVRRGVCLDSVKVGEFVVSMAIESACTLLRVCQSVTDCN